MLRSRAIKKVVLAFVIALNFFSLPLALGANPEIITDAEARDLGLEIPAGTTVGHNIITIEVTDADGNTITRDIEFCYGEDGKTYWNNICPEPTPTPEPSASETPEPTPIEEPAAIDPLNPPPYDPLANPKETSNTIVAGFAAVSAIGAAGAAAAGRAAANSSSSTGSSDGPASLESLEAGELLKLEEEEAAGDKLRSWNIPFTSKVDKAFDKWVEKVSPISPLSARILMDGSYLQAMVGSLSALLYPAALILGGVAANQSHNLPVPPSLGIVVALLFIGTLDSFAGVIAAARFVFGIISAGNLQTRQELFAVLGICTLYFAPVLIASAFRPFRRKVKNGDDRWERLTDIALAVLVGSWVTMKIVGGLSGLAGKQFPIADSATTLAIFAGAFILLRLLLEEAALRWYPKRLIATTPELKPASRNQKIISLALKIDMFIFIGAPFIGANQYLWMATAMFGLPQLLEILYADKTPKNVTLQRMLPTGAVNVVAMVFIGAFFAKFLEGQFDSPAAFVKWSFVLLGIPGIILSILSFFADGDAEARWHQQGLGKIIYRVGGVVIFTAFIAIVVGVDLPTIFFK